MKRLMKFGAIAASVLGAFFAGGPVLAQAIPGPNDDSILRQVIVFGRHSIRTGTASDAQLQNYAVRSYPKFYESYSVPPSSTNAEITTGYLTPRGRQAESLLGSYFRAYLLHERLLTGNTGTDLLRSYFRSNSIQRSYVTAARFGAGLFPDAADVPVHSNAIGGKVPHPDPVIDPVLAGVAPVDTERALVEIQGAYNTGAGLHQAYSGELSLIRSVLLDYPIGTPAPPDPKPHPFVEVTNLPFLFTETPVGQPLFTGGIVKTGGLSTGGREEWDGTDNVADAIDPFVMQYADGMPLDQVAWGMLSKEAISQTTRLNTLIFDLVMRSPYVARVQSSNAASHVLRTMEQVVYGESIRGAFGDRRSRVVVVISSDFYVSGLAGLLGLHWALPGYQPDFVGPGGMLVFELRQPRRSRDYFVRAYFTGQTFDQLRNLAPLTLDSPPATMQLVIPGAGAASLDRPGHGWRGDAVTGLDVSFESFQRFVRSVVDPSSVPDDPVEPGVLPASDVPLN